ncbi:MAG: hypothetical protein M3N53_09265 [Actinomycetota bacterium]|nr:hypothetical protein [Actinomycetota bacterium]
MSGRFRRVAGAALATLVATSAYSATASPVDVSGSILEVSKKAGLGRVEVHGRIGAVLQRDEGTVAILDTSDPASPKVVGRYDTAKDSLDGELAFSNDGKWLFYARQTKTFDEEGLHVLDVSDPKSPKLAFYQPAGGSYRVEYVKQGDAEWVVLLDAIDGLVVYRFNSQTGALVPVHVDALPALKVGGPASADIVYDPKDDVTGKPLLYVTTGKTGLQIFDFSSPAAPVEVSSWEEVGLAEIEVAATKRSRTVYAATEYWFNKSLAPEVIALDATDLGKVVERRRLSLKLPPEEGTFVQGMALDGDRLYVAHSTKGLVVFDTASGKVVGRHIQKGQRNEMAGVMASPYAIDVDLVGRDHLYLTDAATGILAALRR